MCILLGRKNSDLLIGIKLNIGMNYHILKVQFYWQVISIITGGCRCPIKRIGNFKYKWYLWMMIQMMFPFENQKTISSHWIITEKFQNGSRKVKTRLVAREFEKDTSNLRKDSPTCSRESLHLVFSIATTMSWELQSIDITSTFLQEFS